MASVPVRSRETVASIVQIERLWLADHAAEEPGGSTLSVERAAAVLMHPSEGSFTDEFRELPVRQDGVKLLRVSSERVPRRLIGRNARRRFVRPRNTKVAAILFKVARASCPWTVEPFSSPCAWCGKTQPRSNCLSELIALSRVQSEAQIQARNNHSPMKSIRQSIKLPVAICRSMGKSPPPAQNLDYESNPNRIRSWQTHGALLLAALGLWLAIVLAYAGPSWALALLRLILDGGCSSCGLLPRPASVYGFSDSLSLPPIPSTTSPPPHSASASSASSPSCSA